MGTIGGLRLRKGDFLGEERPPEDFLAVIGPSELQIEIKFRHLAYSLF